LGRYNFCNVTGTTLKNCKRISTPLGTINRILVIEDDYEYLDSELIEILKEKITAI